jgi:hypothetical protein
MRTRSEPVTKLYDSACDLLFAAQQLRGAAGERGAVPAMAATLGCIDASLAALSQAMSAMRCTAVAELSAADAEPPLAALLVERELAALTDAITVAQAACDQTRELTAPILAQLELA